MSQRSEPPDEDMLSSVLMNELSLNARDPAGERFSASEWTPIACPFNVGDDSASLKIFLEACRFYRSRNASALLVDARGVLERPCFEAWLRAHTSAYQKPETGFYKALIAHLTGSDGRQAFPAEVEAAVLQDVRQQQVWPCFEGCFTDAEHLQPVRIGMNGFRGTGYHEAMGSFAPGERQHQRQQRSKRVHGTPELFAAPRPIRDPLGLIRSNLAAWADNVVLLCMALRQMGATLDEFRTEPSQEEVPVTPTTAVQVLAPDVTPWTIRAAALVVLTRFFRPQHFLVFVSMSAMGGTADPTAGGFLDPELQALPLAVEQQRLAQSFMHCSEGLLPGLPIGRLTFCTNTFMFTSSDENTKQIQGGDIRGLLAQHVTHPLIAWFHMLHVMPKLIRDGELRWQTLSHNMQGRPVVLRIESKLDGSTVHSSFQDVSELFPELLALQPIDEVHAAALKAPLTPELRQRSVELSKDMMRICRCEDLDWPKT